MRLCRALPGEILRQMPTYEALGYATLPPRSRRRPGRRGEWCAQPECAPRRTYEGRHRLRISKERSFRCFSFFAQGWARETARFCGSNGGKPKLENHVERFTPPPATSRTSHSPGL
jgi:hypothetical protein